MGLDVQVLPADRAEAGAVLPAEDLLRKLERHGVASPGAQLEVLVDDVVGAQLVGGRRIEVVELPWYDRALDLGEAEAAHARACQVHVEAHVEDHGARRL